MLIGGAVAASAVGFFCVIAGPTPQLDLALEFVVRGTLDRAIARKEAAHNAGRRPVIGPPGDLPVGSLALDVGRAAAISVAASALIRLAFRTGF
ncbi:MAG: hypothetical protein C0511_09390 [Hyphomicrobium sp.]|nr:hypothetical protein [Hyphomicrobium sp.]